MGGIVLTGSPGIPLPKDEQQDIAPGTPLAIIGLWVLALRSRFAVTVGEGLPWIWTEELQTDAAEDGIPLPDGHPRKIMIEAAFNVEKSVSNYRPAIYVNRGPINAIKLHVDNRVGKSFPSNFTGYHAMSDIPIVFDCVAENSGESAIIGDTAWFFVLATRDLFRKDFGFHEITNPTLGPTVPDNEDKTVWKTSVSFTIQADLRWGTEPLAPILNDITATIKKSDDVQRLLRSIVMRETNPDYH